MNAKNNFDLATMKGYLYFRMKDQFYMSDIYSKKKKKEKQDVFHLHLQQ